MKDKVRQIIRSSMDNKPAEAKAAIIGALREKIKVALQDKSQSLAKSIFNKKEGN